MQQLYAEIKESSKYHYQARMSADYGHTYPFLAHIEPDFEGYVVKGGIGGQYRLEDVALFVLDDDGSKTYITQ